MSMPQARSRTLKAVLAAASLALFATSSPGVAQSARCGEPSAASQLASAEEEARLVALSNQTRTERNLPPLAVDGELTDRARSWSERMAREGVLSHSDLDAGTTSTAPAAAENVGCDESVESLHQSLVASPSHYANLVEPAFTHVGVGLARATDGMLYTTQVFMTSTGADSPAPRSQR